MSNGISSSEIVGKKVFFLYPTAVVQNKIFEELVQQEYEVYMAKDHSALGRVLKKYPDSIVFVNINEQLAEKDWETWIKGLMNNPGTGDVIIGIVTTNDSEELRHKYIETIGIKGGYTLLRSELDTAIKQIIAILNTADAKGRRKYLRATTETENMTTVNLPHSGAYINGQIKDISVVGLSCAFDNDPELLKNTLFKGIQVKLQSMLLNVEGIVFGSRMDGNSKIYVILFTQRIDPVVRTKIRRYIQQNLQSKMDSELK
ncbi:MAG: PilZ domain-containing protein [Treponema sp.]|jgi:hypothetical protein|nr:PilZ domain-containing protein [Treponema sp.]